MSASLLGPGSLAETDVRVQAEVVAKSTPSHTCADVLIIYQHMRWVRHVLPLSNRHLWLPGQGLPSSLWTRLCKYPGRDAPLRVDLADDI